jgi:hypothetical protein
LISGGEGNGQSEGEPMASHVSHVHLYVSEVPLLFMFLPMHSLLSKTNNNEEGIEKFDKSLWRANDKF